MKLVGLLPLREYPFTLKRPDPKVIKRISCSTLLSRNFFLIINVRMLTIVGILTFLSRKNNIVELSEPENAEFPDIFIFMSI